MADDSKTPEIKVTDRRQFEKTGEKRQHADRAPEAEAGRPAGTSPPPGGSASSRSGGATERPSEPSAGGGSGPSQGSGLHTPDSGHSGEMSEIASTLSSSFSLLVARLAQETEIYLGLVPYPGKETSEPDLEAARAMIDLLSMLQEKTRGNLEPEEARLLENLLYTYRLEYVRLKPDAGAR